MPRRISFVFVLGVSLVLVAFVSVWANTTPSSNIELTVIGWNVEPAGADPVPLAADGGGRPIPQGRGIRIAGQLAAFDGAAPTVRDPARAGVSPIDGSRLGVF